jgi:hypothetical protein
LMMRKMGNPPAGPHRCTRPPSAIRYQAFNVPIGALRHPDLDAEIHPHPARRSYSRVRQSRAGRALHGGSDRLKYA